jgi:hypothetical protein
VSPDPLQLAAEVRAALIDAAVAAYEDAATRGLCAEGALEAALGAMRAVDLSYIVKKTLMRSDAR